MALLDKGLRQRMVGALVPMVPEGLVLMTSIAFAVGVVRLGRRQVDERFQRFVTAGVHQIATHANDIHYIDMRYTNGFAIGWRVGGQRVASGDPEDDN